MVVSSFEFDENAAREAGISLKVFDSYSKEWADFILANRKNDTRTQIHDFDKASRISISLQRSGPSNS